LGLARAHLALGNPGAAAVQYRRLAAIWKGRDFPELDEAKRHLAAVGTD
jgi:hypothetical protein